MVCHRDFNHLCMTLSVDTLCIAAYNAASVWPRTAKMLRASRDSGKMMLEVMLEAWGEEIKQKMCFSSFESIKF